MIALVTTSNTVDHLRIVTNQLINQANTLDANIASAFGQANTARTQGNTAYGQGNSAYTYANTVYAYAQTVFVAANAAFGKANTANSTAVGNTLSEVFTQRSTRARLNFIPGSNITINVDDDSSGDRANITITSTASGGGDANLAFDQANTARIHANSAFLQANGAGTQANTARDHANAAFGKANTANNIAVGNTSGVAFTQRSARERLNFIPGTNITINVDDDSSGNRVNVTITSTAADGAVAAAAIVQANTARDHANAAFLQANTARDQANTGRGHANTGWAHANAAFAKANAALANTSTTLSGSLTITGNVQATNVRATGAYIYPNGNVITNLTVSTSSPSGGANGDIWLKIV